jgi:NadR type nicotinamide-nucleotide adenylyltransferase
MSIRRVLLVGAESTGKTTLASLLASEYDTVWVPEFGRAYGFLKDQRKELWDSNEFLYVARVQEATEDVAVEYAHRLLFCDTDVLTTALFHEEYLGRIDPLLEQVGREARYDLTFLCATDIPFEPDGARRRAAQERFQRRLTEGLRDRGPVVLLRGSVENRMDMARRAIHEVLGIGWVSGT